MANIAAYFGETIKSGSGVIAVADYSGTTSVAGLFGPTGVGGFPSGQFQFVVIQPYTGAGSSSASNAGATVVTTAGQGGVKVLTNKPQQGDPCALVDVGETKVLAGAALTIGQIVMSDANGRAVPWIENGQNVPVGEVRVPANVANDVVTIFMFSNFAGEGSPVQLTQYTSISGAAVTAAQIAGAQDVTLASSGTTALTTPTAAQIIAAVPNWAIGDSYRLRVINTNAGVLTLTGGAGVTINGTATVAANTSRDFYVTYSAAGAVTFQNIGSGTV